MKKLISIMLCAVIILSIMPISEAATVQTFAIEPKYDTVFEFHDGLAAVEKHGKWGFIDKRGKEVITLKYDWAESFSEGLAAVEKNGKWGFIDKTGKEVIALQYNNGARGFSEGLAAVDDNGRNIYLDKTGKEVMNVSGHFAIDYAYSFSEGLAAFFVRDYDKLGLYVEFGFIDKRGKEVIAPQYNWADSFSEGLAAVEKDGLWGFIDKTGKKVIALKYDSVLSFSEGLAAVEKDGKWGYIDKTGKEVVALKYEYTDYFSEGLALVKKDEKTEYDHEYAFIDKKGKEVIVLQVDLGANPFSEGLALVDGWRFIDKKGKVVIELQEDQHARPFSEGLAAVEKDGKWGFIANPLTASTSNSPTNASVVLDGSKLTLTPTAQVLKGTTFVPLRGVFENMGAKIDWDQKKQLVTITHEGKKVELTIGSKTAKVDGKAITLTTVPFVQKGYTFVPLRFISQSIGATVVWDQSTYTVNIKTK